MNTSKKKLFRNTGKVVKTKVKICWAWWCIPVIPVAGRLKQEDPELRPAWTT
jgi:hypothetical protein